MNSKMIVKKFKHDLEQGWSGDYYRGLDGGEPELTATHEEIAADWIFAQFGNSTTAQFAKEVLAEDDSWKSLV